MKHCPACNFSFPDFQRVCDFDGTELVKDPEPRSLIKVVNMKASPRPSRFRRSLNSPVFWSALLLMAVLGTAFLAAYYDATNHFVPVVKLRPTPAATASAKPGARPSDQIAEVNTPANSTESSAHVRRPAKASRSLARLGQIRSNGVRLRKLEVARLQKTEIARRREAQSVRSEKQPKLVAMMKTTWRVLTKPFKF